MPAGEPDYRRYLDPVVLARVSGLALRARLIVEGYYAGSHRSPYRGRSVEFADHRPYVQGDDLRYVDWKVYGRTNKYYIKEFEQETNLNLVLALDVSESMAYASAGAPLNKHDYAAAAAAALACLSLQQHDSVGLVRFDKAVVDFLKPSNSPGQWRALIRAMAQGPAGSRGNLRLAFEEIAERIDRRSLVVVISDLLDDPEGLLRGVRHLRFRRNDVVVLQILDRGEIEFPFSAATLFDGLESAGRLVADADAVRRAYLEEFAAYARVLDTACRRMQVDLARISTATRLDAALRAYLAHRAAGMKSRHFDRRKGA